MGTNSGGKVMNEPDYCKRCNLYTMQKQEPEADETEDVWYCPICDQFEVKISSTIGKNNRQETKMEPKFKAWDKDSKVMRSWNDLILTKDEGDDFWLIGYKENTCITSFDHDQVLIQSTGVPDKNGVEIYEGFLVKPERGEPFVVEHFIKGQGIIKHVNISASGHSFEGIYSGPELEVIGDIYTNTDAINV